MPRDPKAKGGVRLRLIGQPQPLTSHYSVSIYKGQIGSCANVVNDVTGEHVKSFSTRQYGAQWLKAADAYAAELNDAAEKK